MWRETGSVEDEAAWLRARILSGELDLKALGLAAVLRYEPAVRASPSSSELWADLGPLATQAEVERRLRALVERLDAESWEVHCRVALAARRYCNSNCLQEAPPASGSDYLYAAEAYVVCPCEEHEQIAAETGIHLARMIAGRSFMGRELVHVWELKRVVHRVATQSPGTHWGQACVAVLEAVAEELVPWTLGYRDPVRERVEACQRDQVSEGAAEE